jgi:DNA-binding CsgD family transcriptional regulator/predicted RNA-binding Zn-ribbon protein involved in translation (DUF1610 family)
MKITDYLHYDIVGTIASLHAEAIYIIDLKKQNFYYVSDHDLCLCGRSQKEIMRQGHNFYAEIIHQDDLFLFENIYYIINSYITEHPDVSYFSFIARIKNHSQTDESDYLKVFHKLKPIFSPEGELILGAYLLTLSTKLDSGNIRAYCNDSLYFDEYSIPNEEWTGHKIEYLTKREMKILEFHKQGFDNKTIAGKLCIASDTLRHTITMIYEKLGVKNMKQAQALAINFPRLFKMTSSNGYAEKPADSQLPQTDKGKKSKVASQIREKLCPHCGNNDSVKSGKTRKGYQRWRCKKCYKYFQSETETKRQRTNNTQ